MADERTHPLDVPFGCSVGIILCIFALPMAFLLGRHTIGDEGAYHRGAVAMCSFLFLDSGASEDIGQITAACEQYYTVMK